MAGGLAHVWKEWGIQIMVLLSFLLQVFLLSFAGIRRRKASVWLRSPLWLAYQLADSTAMYTLGNLAVANRKAQDQYLYAFWASFLLVHLGGPGNITAYSLEDNRLWLRHVATLVVQVLGAAYVIYKYITFTRPLVLLAAILVFLVGILRYCERIWALRWGNLSTIRSHLMKREDPTAHFWCCCLWKNTREPEEQIPFDIGDEELLQGAQSMFDLCQSRFVGVHFQEDEYPPCYCRRYRKENVFEIVEMELSLMYDILYTKAAVIHTWYGYCILVISPLATATALVLFHSSNKNGDGKFNVAITYALLSGTLALETISVVRAMGATWACALTYKWKPLRGAVTFLRRLFKAGSKRRWSGKIGQYNMLHLWTRDRTELRSRLGWLAARLGLQSWWNRVHYSSTIAISKTDLKDRILRLRHAIRDRDSRGVRVLERMGLDKNSGQFARWTLSKADFDFSVPAWHIATDMYLTAAKEEHKDEKNLVAAVRVLSNYMMFLVMVQPEMLPGTIRNRQLHDKRFDEILGKLWNECSAEQNQGNPFSLSKWNMLNKLFKKLGKLFQRDDPNDPSRIKQREEFARKLLIKLGLYPDDDDELVSNDELVSDNELIQLSKEKSIHAAYYGGALLTRELRSMDTELKIRRKTVLVLELIFEVWLEMLCYAAHHCSRDSHASQLNNGGELITIIWILTHHPESEIQKVTNRVFKKYQEDDQDLEAFGLQHLI